MQSAILWEIGHALHYNFFSDIAALAPPEHASEASGSVEAELDKLRVERDVLLRALGKSSTD